MFATFRKQQGFQITSQNPRATQKDTSHTTYLYTRTSRPVTQILSV